MNKPCVRLGRLLAMSGPTLEGLGDAALAEGGPEVTDLVISSREVGPGALFACVPGQNTDGHDFAAEAVARGAVALICERGLRLPVPEVVVPSVRRALGPLSAALWSFPSAALSVVGVTGTNGKTTTCAMLASIFSAAGKTASVIGTLSGVRTTPEAPDLQRRLAGLRDGGVQAVAMEVSSHALAQHRVAGTEFAAAVFTNLSRDHLDYHGTMEDYFEAKASLFTGGAVALAVVNRADESGSRLVARLERLSLTSPAGGRLRVVSYSPEDASGVSLTREGASFSWRGKRLSVPLPGRFNVANAVAAATVAAELGLGTDSVAAGLASLQAVHGRFELVEEGQSFTVVVDFAHTPAALAAALGAARDLAGREPAGVGTAGVGTPGKGSGSSRVIVVFGAGGDRDPGKRPEMGRVASELADVVVVTSDNPRTEPPLSIIELVVAGAARPPLVEVDRAAAIERAIGLARPGDVVLVAGKGHETGQDFGARVEPFDDVQVARRLLRSVTASRAAGR